MSKNTSPPVDAMAARMLALADACVLCGLCLPHCPTYRIDARESESPRGRVMLLRAMAESALSGMPSMIPDRSSIEALDHCIGCGRCEQVCPAKVRYSELWRLGRSRLRPSRRPLVAAALWASRHPQIFAGLVACARPLRALLPRRARRVMEATVPLQNAVSLRHFVSASAPAGSQRIGLLLGCVSRSLEPAALDAAHRLLHAAGHSVLAPDAQVCCGALDAHAGQGRHVEALQERNRAVWRSMRIDRAVSVSSGCQGAFAATLDGVAEVSDMLQFLAEDPGFARVKLRAMPMRVALHLPCSQRGLPGSVPALRRLLARVPGLEVIDLPDTGCCGAGGAHMLQYPERAQALRQPLVDALTTCGATTLLSANIGCRLHLAQADALDGIRIQHPLELLAEALP